MEVAYVLAHLINKINAAALYVQCSTVFSPNAGTKGTDVHDELIFVLRKFEGCALKFALFESYQFQFINASLQLCWTINQISDLLLKVVYAA